MKPSTGWPFLNAYTVGMDWMRSCRAISWFSSMFTLTSFTAPFASVTTFSMMGPSVLHGPHHGAQKSTITGTSRLVSITSAANVSSPLSFICGLSCVAGAAGALVTPNKRVKRGELWAGGPAKLMRPLSETEIAEFADTVAHYCEKAETYRRHL